MKHLFLVIALLMMSNYTIAADSRPSGKITVTAEGAAAVEGSVNSREKAINDALRAAVMNAVGAYVSSTNVGSSYQEIEDRVFVKAQGFARLDEVLEERETDGIIKVKIRATVSVKPLAELLKGLGITRDWKVAVVMGGKKDNKTAAEIEKALIDAGFRTVDAGWNEKLAADEIIIRSSSINKSDMVKIRQEYGVDVLVVGETSSGRINLRAFYTDTAELLTVVDGKTAKEASDKLVEDLLAAPAELSPFVTVKVSGFAKASDASHFENALRELRGVRTVKRQRFTRGTLELNAYVNREDLDSLAENLEEHDYMRPFNILVETWSKTLITCRIQTPSADVPRKGASYIVVPPKQ